jgi:hypothetical protein
MNHVLLEAWVNGIFLQSQFFRDNSFDVAVCASEGLITTKGIDGSYHNRWLITPKGLSALWETN